MPPIYFTVTRVETYWNGNLNDEVAFTTLPVGLYPIEPTETLVVDMGSNGGGWVRIMGEVYPNRELMTGTSLGSYDTGYRNASNRMFYFVYPGVFHGPGDSL
jgi:hypothetical protein